MTRVPPLPVTFPSKAPLEFLVELPLSGVLRLANHSTQFENE